MRRVVVLGASVNPERHSNQAVRKLRQHGHDVVPVHPAHASIEGLPVVKSLSDVVGPIDTITLYVGPRHIQPLIDPIVASRPLRVIANPGAESDALRSALAEARIAYVEACTLVLLRTNQF